VALPDERSRAEREPAQADADRPAPRRKTRVTNLLGALNTLDWIAIALLVVGGACVASGLLPVNEAEDTVRRILPLLLFLGTVIVLAELTAEAQVFDVFAARLAILGRGNYALLFLLCVALTSITTIVLNLDTTAVLLTPVMLALAAKLRIAPLPVAIMTIWLANTASLLLPVSNLTNLLAADRVALKPIEFAERMWLPQLASIAATMLCLWVFYWRRGRRDADRYVPPMPQVPAQRSLFVVAAAACLLFVTGLLVGTPLGATSAFCAALVVIAFAARSRSTLRPALIPWRLLVFVTGLFLVIQTVSRHGLGDVVHSLIGEDGGAAGVFRAAATGAGMSNLLNNLPSYVAGEAVVPVDNHTQLLGLLIGTNVGPIVTPWASLATLLCYERCQAHGVEVPLRRLMLTGAVLAALALPATIGALLLVA
jgi:arsenical pump membrane protein